MSVRCLAKQVRTRLLDFIPGVVMLFAGCIMRLAGRHGGTSVVTVRVCGLCLVCSKAI